ncbi:MAG: 23S rRNA (uracil(1939)-C(5))-methyltransferase RlmD [Thermodesulfovibrionales bacterium]
MSSRAGRGSEPIEVLTEAFHDQGQGLGRWKGRPVLVWGALPGERVKALPMRRKAGFLHAVVSEVLDPSPERVAPLEEHYLSCSPWQILRPEAEAGHKALMARRVFREQAGMELPEDLEVVEGSRRLGYRNKMEFSFTAEGPAGLSLALHRRLSRRKAPLSGCVLASGAINAGAARVVDALRGKGVPEAALKTLVMRSGSGGEALAALFVKDEGIPLEAGEVKGLQGVSIYFSDPARVASVPTRLLSQAGSQDLVEEVGPPGAGGRARVRLGLLSFFQVNVEVFEKALSDMAPHLEGDVVEFYSGAGAITVGASRAASIRSALLVDSDAGAIELARENIRINGLEGRFSAVAAPAEKLMDEVTPGRVALFDPPRSGLHPKLLRKVAEARPAKVIYLSCNVRTQASDLRELLPFYRVSFLRLYNFFPRTPHIESLAVLELKGGP